MKLTAKESAVAADVTMTAAVPADLASELRALAERNDRSLSAEVRRALRTHIATEAALTSNATRGGCEEPTGGAAA